MSDNTEVKPSTYKMVMQAVILVTALFAQGITIYAYMKSEITKIAQVEQYRIVNEEFEKKSELYNQMSLRITNLENDKIRKDLIIEDMLMLKSDMSEQKEQVRELESLTNSNFRLILRERRRIDEMVEEDQR